MIASLDRGMIVLALGSLLVMRGLEKRIEALEERVKKLEETVDAIILDQKEEGKKE